MYAEDENDFPKEPALPLLNYISYKDMQMGIWTSCGYTKWIALAELQF